MAARGRRLPLAGASLLALAIALGVLSAAQPLIALAAVAAAVVAYVIFSDLAAGFGILMFLSFLSVLPASGSLTPAKGAGLLLALAWVARYTTVNTDVRDFAADHPTLTWLMIGLLGWAAASVIWAPSTSAALGGLSQYFLTLLLIPIAYTAVRRRRDLKLALVAIVLGAALAAAVGILQPPNAEVVESTRATGTIGDPNELAADLLAGLAIATGFVLARGERTSFRLLALAAIPLCALGIFISVSRGGLVALVVVFLVAAFAAGRWRLAAVPMLVLVAVGGVLYFTAFAPLPARERVLTTNGGTGRTELWQVGLRIVRAHPVGGVGVGNYVQASPQYVLAPGVLHHTELIFTQEPKPAHNTYLQVAGEMGLPGLLLFLAVIAGCMRCALRGARIAATRRDIVLEAQARGVFLATVGVLAALFFISQMHSKVLWGLLALSPALLSVARHDSDTSREGLEETRRAALAALSPVA
jgi:O-antigen ligase